MTLRLEPDDMNDDRQYHQYGDQTRDWEQEKEVSKAPESDKGEVKVRPFEELTINVDEIKGIDVQGEQRRRHSLNIDAKLSAGKMQAIFYQLWSKVGDDGLNDWLNSEGYALVKK